MGRKSLILSAAYVTLMIAAAGTAAASSEDSRRVLDPPRDASGQAYLDAVAGRGLQTNISYLSKQEKAEEPEDDGGLLNLDFDFGETTGWVLFGLMAAAIAFLAYRSRNGLAELAGPRNGAKLPAASRVEPLQTAAIDHGLIERLRAEDDPRTGLRLVLQRFLALAAQESSIPVKRSLTTREIMARLPGGFSHRRELETLASEVERVVFGGHTMDNAHYQHCLDLAAPFLRRMKA